MIKAEKLITVFCIQFQVLCSASHVGIIVRATTLLVARVTIVISVVVAGRRITKKMQPSSQSVRQKVVVISALKELGSFYEKRI